MTASDPSHILILEDDGDLLEVLKYVIEDAGYQVSIAKDAETALAIAAAERVDLAVLDVAMPEVSGLQVARLLRSSPSMADIRLVIHTGLDESTVRKELEDFDSFVLKSEDPQRLLAEIASLLSGRRTPVALDGHGPTYSFEDALLGHRALRQALGLQDRPLDSRELLGMMRLELEQLLSLGKTSSEIAVLLSTALGREVDLGDLTPERLGERSPQRASA